MRKLFPLLLAILGLGLGICAGVFLRPVPEEMAAGECSDPEKGASETEDPADPETLPEYVKLNNQFVIPVVQQGKVASMVILSLSLEVSAGSSAEVYTREPKLRDAFLQVMFDHANAGGFDGSFTDGSNLVLLRNALGESAARILGDVVIDVLVSDIARQDT